MSMDITTVGIKFLNALTIQVVQQPPATPDYRGIFTFTTGWYTSTGENMSNTMQTGTYATLSVQWVDQGGQPAKVDGPTTWATSDASICTIEVSTGNPLIANVHSLGPIGPVQFQATADADMGQGVRNITATCDVSVIGGEAYAGEINFTQYGTTPPPAKGGVKK